MGKRSNATTTAEDESLPTKRMRASQEAPAENPEATPDPTTDGLLTLNHDCLLRVFDFTKLGDLCRIAKTCTALRDLAKYQFRLKYRNFDFAYLIDDGFVDLQMAGSVFSIFGEEISSLNLSIDLFVPQTNTSAKLLLLANTYCKVKELTLDGLNQVPLYVVQSLRTMFKSVETLRIDSCSIQLDSYMYDWKNLKTLTLKEFNCQWSEFLGKKFGSLEKVEFMCMIGLHTEHLIDFLNRNQGLKSLSIIHCGQVSSEIFGAVAELTNLEEFEFQQNEFDEGVGYDAMCLSSLKKLKVLKLSCDRSSVATFLKRFKSNDMPIEHLELAGGRIDDDAAEAIATLKTVKVLKLNEMTGIIDAHILSIVKGLHLLEELVIKTRANILQRTVKKIVCQANRLTCFKIDIPNFTLGSDTYQEMLTVVQKREEPSQLELTIYDKGEQVLVPSGVLRGKNEKWMAVKELNRKYNRIFRYKVRFHHDDSDDDSGDDSDRSTIGIDFADYDDSDREFSDSDDDHFGGAVDDFPP